jgi:hypothetical protein
MANNGFGYNAYSSTIITVLDTVATTVTATIDRYKAYSAGARVRFSDSINPADNYFEGIVSSYNYGTGVITISDINVKEGSGSHNAWNINIAGEKGDNGQNALNGTNGTNGSNGSNGSNGADGKGYDATSVSSIDVLTNASTSGSWTMSTGKAFLPFQRIRVSYSATEYFEGMLTAYDSSTGAFTMASIDLKVGSSTHSTWNIGIAGVKGTDGSNGSNGTNGVDGRGYDATSSSSIDTLTNSGTSGSWTMTAGKAYLAGDRVRLSYSATEYFEGILSAYNSLTGGFSITNIDVKVGSSTHSSWSVSLAGEPGFKNRYVEKTANYTLTAYDFFVNCTSGSFNITLPTAASHNRPYKIKNSGTGQITLVTTGGETINVNSSETYASGDIVIEPGEVYDLQSNGTNYEII